MQIRLGADWHFAQIRNVYYALLVLLNLQMLLSLSEKISDLLVVNFNETYGDLTVSEPLDAKVSKTHLAPVAKHRVSLPSPRHSIRKTRYIEPLSHLSKSRLQKC